MNTFQRQHVVDGLGEVVVAWQLAKLGDQPGMRVEHQWGARFLSSIEPLGRSSTSDGALNAHVLATPLLSGRAFNIGQLEEHAPGMGETASLRYRTWLPAKGVELVVTAIGVGLQDPRPRLLVAELPTYGYRRVHALLRRQAEQTGCAAPNPRRVYHVMKVHGLLLQRDSEHREERRHDGGVAVDQRNTRWCSDGPEIARDDGEKVRVGFALDCCDREAMGHVATTGGLTAEDGQDLMVATVEHRYGPVNRLPEPLEWLTDNGSCYTGRDNRAFASDIGLNPRTTPVSSPRSNGVAGAFVRSSTPSSATMPA